VTRALSIAEDKNYRKINQRKPPTPEYEQQWAPNTIQTVILICNAKGRERDHWGDLGVGGWIILGWISRRWDVGMWTGIGLAQDRDRWRALVSAVMNLRVP